jgi:hypothetical protein
LLQAEDVEHFGSATEGDGLFLLSRGERRKKNRNESALAPRQAVRGMTSHL